MNDNLIKNETMYLHGLGWQPWSVVVDHLNGFMCAWADYEGFHFGECPSEAPPYSHLWAWQIGTVKKLARIRIDPEHGTGKPGGYVGFLTSQKVGPDANPVETTCCVTEPILWDDDEKRLGANARNKGLMERNLTVYQPILPMSATFFCEKLNAETADADN